MALVEAGVVVLDCVEPTQLATFYKELLDAEETEATVDRVEIRGAGGTRMAFSRDALATPPSWPRPEESFHTHLDFYVEDLDGAERRVVALGGRPIEMRDPGGGLGERSYADPAGHTFTLRRVIPAAPEPC
ncbi:hypothetical protein SGFS_101380 [Streptomyces graminofaciens]|jgi:hypothetical protein|uniref:VOC domain-containing protein n=1 Tax=Streptomyces graminofaciens TaxID=68212 RepID=A0ABM7FPY4_9ACTN|nr:VOC family protein [Streptomyces graminofaciens]BBC38844.1 hypothetical protein SGFS_101380 [Streptomyces graminofaciens]